MYPTLPQARRGGEQLELFFELAVDILAVAGLDGYFHRTSSSVKSILGYDPAEMAKRAFLEFVPSEDRGRVWCIFSLLAKGETVRDFETRFERKDGSYCWISWNMSAPVGDGMTYMVGRDVTAGREAEQQLNRTLTEMMESRSQLEAQAVQLARQAAELALARETAEAAARLKGSFLATMSHEIRTPMNGVLGMVSLLDGTALSDEQREYLDTIRVSGESLLEIINDVLDFSKTDAGKTRFESMPFDLARCCEEAADMLAARAASKQLDLSVFVSPACPAELRGDPGRLRQVLVNLLGNALKFTEMGQVALRVEPAQPDGGRLRFEVRDTGIGIPKSALPKLFQPFMQADNSTTRRFGGTGLGLAICKQIIEASGGRIGAFSEPGQGATFWFEIDWPVTREAACQECGEIAGSGVVLLARGPGLRETLSRYLETWSATVTSVSSLEAARKAIETDERIRYLVAEAGASFGAPVAELAALGRQFPRLKTAVASWPGSPAIDDARALRVEVLYRPIKRGRLLAWAAGAAARPEAAAAGESGATGGASLRILVAEDNPVNQRIALKMLERLGHDATIAVDGREALERAQAETFDLILMDCQMPVMDGFQAAREIRRRSPKPPIVALTANALEGDRQHCLNAGMDDYLAKPIDLAALREMVDRWRAPAPAAETA